MNEDVRTLQTMLQTIAACTDDVSPVIPDGFYGRNTENSVRSFQKAAGLPVTGKVGRTDWEKITEAYMHCSICISEPQPLQIRLPQDAVLNPGSRNLHIHLLQVMLTVLGKQFSNLPVVSVTGVLDAETAAAIAALQRLCGYNPTGTADRHFWQMLTGLYRLTAGNGKT